MKNKLSLPHFLSTSSNLALQIKIFTWCLEGSTFSIKWFHPFVAYPPFDNFKIPPAYMLFQVL